MKHTSLSLLVLTSLVAGPAHSAQTTPTTSNPRSTAPGLEYAVFTELSPASKILLPGWNTRVFTDTDARQGDSIQCDFETGLITLAPGTYHITGYSIVVYDSGGEPPEMATIRAPAAGGYSRVRIHDPTQPVDPTQLRGLPNDDPLVLSIGSPSTPNITPSLFETYLTTEKSVQILVEHQSGSNPDHTYLRIYVENSKWHALARISIRRL